MLTRRGFLGASGVGILAASSLCRPFEAAAQFQVPVGAKEALQRLAQLKSQKIRLLGYPINMNDLPDAFLQWRSQLTQAGLNTFAYNNVGNPYHRSPIAFNTHVFERETIEAFGRLLAFPDHDTWGFLSHSGTDSNMHGMYIGRTLLKGRTGIAPKAYFTDEAHYSIQILRDLLNMESEIVATLPDGSMDPEDLGRRLADNARKPALVVATIGTTFKGAIDNIDLIQEQLRGHASYLHLDAALFGGYLPYTAHASEVAHQSHRETGRARYDSIAISCHKFFGFPTPAGLFITTRNLYDEFNELFGQIHRPEYLHQVPGTITCSRDAVAPAEFHFFSRPAAHATLAEDANRMLANTDYLFEQLRTHFPELAPARAHPLSNTVYLKCPGETVVQKYSLATMTLNRDGAPTRFSHVVVMPHVTRQVIAAFLNDLQRQS